MTTALQDALATLAAAVGRPALLEDRSHAVIAYSQHLGVTDPVREQTILGHRAPEAVRSWLARYRLHAEVGPVHLPANDELRMLPRLCLPVRERDLLLGFLWFVEGREPLGDEAVALALSRLPPLAQLLREEQHSSRTQLSDVLHKILAGGTPDSADLETCSAAGLSPDRPLRVLCATGRVPTGESWEPTLEDLARRAGAATLVPLAETAPALVVGGLLQPLDPPALPEGTGIGLGDEVASVAELRRAFRTAVDAAACAAAFPETRGFLDWTAAGLYRMVPVLAGGQADTVAIDGVTALLGDPRTASLARTATVYLDLAGNAQAAAAALHLHRTSLYYRLERFESETGVDLREGRQRTAIHLALKVAAYRRAGAQH